MSVTSPTMLVLGATPLLAGPLLIAQRDARLRRLAVGIICLHMAPTGAVAQTLVDLTIAGPAAVVEESYADYTATARFDDGREFEVTLFCAWSVDPETYASIDQFGRLTTEAVTEDQAIVVQASFTWEEVTRDDALDVTIYDVPEDPNGDPWPMWQRTASRVGRTATVGPRTPTLAWKLRIDPSDGDTDLDSSAVIDAEGRLFVGVRRQVTCVDTIARRVLWGFPTYLKVNGTPALWEGRVLFGTTSADEHTFYCVNAETGEEIWNFFVGPELITSSPVVEDGVVYFNAGPMIYARRVEDGSEVWTRDMGAGIHTSPSLEARRQLFGGSDIFVEYFAFDLADGATRWEFPLDGFPRGTGAVENGRLYVSTRGGPTQRLVYCIGTESGGEIWRFEDSPRDLTGTVALGHGGRAYAMASVDWLFCLDADDGTEIWRHDRGAGLCRFAPIVDGSETIYFGVASGSAYRSVRAVRPDGTELWRYPMPAEVFPSPVLAPDGTLYVICSDKYLYAFKDPPQPPTPEPVELSDPIDAVPVSP